MSNLKNISSGLILLLCMQLIMIGNSVVVAKNKMSNNRYLGDGEGGYANSCYWDKCQEETKAYSIYYDGLSSDGQNKLARIIQNCGSAYGEESKEQCEKLYNVASYTDVQFTDFYSCVQQCLQISYDVCREENERCEFCMDGETCSSYRANDAKRTALNEAISVEKCTLSNTTTCPDTLKSIAQSSCQLYGRQICQNEWVEANITEEDACYPCDKYAASSLKLSFSLIFIVLAYII